jgi:protein SCO1/2
MAALVWPMPVAHGRPEHVIYEARGVLKTIDPAARQVRIAHEEIVGYMPAMTMSFDVLDPKELAGLQPGDTLSFHLCVVGDRAWIEQLHKKDGAAPLFTPPELRSGRELGPGEPLPDLEFVDQSGQKRSLHDYRGRVLALTFIYTRCPLPTYCPLMNRNFDAVQGLMEKLGAGPDWHLLSLTLDPKHDTPAVLSAYSQNYHADGRHWTFATASADALDEFAASLGLELNRTADRIDHNLRTVVVEADGKIRRVFPGNQWTPQELAAELRAAMPKHR